MRIIALIEDGEVIRKILKYLGLRDPKARPPPKANATPLNVRIIHFDSQLPHSKGCLYSDVDCPIEKYALVLFAVLAGFSKVLMCLVRPPKALAITTDVMVFD